MRRNIKPDRMDSGNMDYGHNRELKVRKNPHNANERHQRDDQTPYRDSGKSFMEQHSLKVPKKSKYNGADNQQTQGNKGIPKINTKTNEITSDEPVYTAKRSNASLSSR